MAKPIDPSLTTDPNLNIQKDSNLSISTISAKTLYFKLGAGVSADKGLLEITTKDPGGITLNDEIKVSDTSTYYVQNVFKTPVKFGTGTPLLNQNTSVKFPKPEAKQYTPEKVATFLIFKK
jgi:hypothetical protein